MRAEVAAGGRGIPFTAGCGDVAASRPLICCGQPRPAVGSPLLRPRRGGCLGAGVSRSVLRLNAPGKVFFVDSPEWYLIFWTRAGEKIHLL